jgi:transposase
MWTRETRAEHDRDDLRYPSDLTDAEWDILALLQPAPAQAGRHRSWQMGELINAIFFVGAAVCRGAFLEHFPPHQTTYRWFMRFRDDGTWKSLNHHLVMLDRMRAGCKASPSAPSSTRRASRPPRSAVRAATMPPRRSRAANVTPW